MIPLSPFSTLIMIRLGVEKIGGVGDLNATWMNVEVKNNNQVDAGDDSDTHVV